MTVQFGAITSKNLHSAHRNQGIGSQYRAQNKYNAQLATALRGSEGRRVGYGNRFYNNPYLANKFTTTDSSSSSSSRNWTAITASGLSAGISGAVAGYSCGGWIGAAVGGVLGAFGGGYAAWNS